MNSAPFIDNVVLITGASRGIGEELAGQLSVQGARLALASRDVPRLEAVAGRCAAMGAQVIWVPTDVADPAQCLALVERTVETYGRVDTLINNAGITMWARLEDVKELSIFEKIIRVNYLGSVYCTYYTLPYLKSSRGRIVAVSSLTGKAGVPTRSGYAASKHAMAGFFDTLRIELAPYGVSVTVVYPGFVDTRVRERALGPDGQPLGWSPVQEEKVMKASTCAQIILKAAAKRRREEVMTLRGKLGQWLKLIAPALVDRIAARAIEVGK
jgi:NAD(P)-dependent dehydrogenase (short-subunit alcohol dehydrogenase family)